LKKKIFINYTLTFIIFFSFVYGIFFLENSSGGAQNDSIHVLNNFDLFKTYKLTNFPWEKYDSSSLPIYYFFLDIFFETKKNLPNLNIFLSLVTLFFFFKIIKKKLYKKLDQSYVLLFSIIIFLSPYLRSSTFWGLEEVIGNCFFTISLYFLLLNDIKKKLKYAIISIFFACLAFYSRQSYIFLVIFVFLDLISIKNKISKNNFIVCFLFFILLIPSLYFFYHWKSIFPPIAENSRTFSINLSSIPFILSMLSIYLIPFLILKTSNLGEIKIFFLKNFINLIILTIFFVLILELSSFSYLGGGAIKKFLLLFIKNGIIFNVLISFIGSLTAIFIFRYFDKKLKYFTFFLILTFVNIDIVFNEYFDPIYFIFLVANFNFKKIDKTIIEKFIYSIVTYFSLFLIGAKSYYL